MLARVRSSAINGVEACLVDVEVTVRDGQQKFVIIGLGDSAIREARDRVSSAIKQSGFKTPDQILVNLAPAELKKEGSAFDLPMAVGILSASRALSVRVPATTAFHGELSLDGKVKTVRGMVALALEARRSRMQEIIVPLGNYREASLVKGLKVVGVRSLLEVCQYLKGDLTISVPEVTTAADIKETKRVSEVVGQKAAKRAMAIAAAGGHNLLMIGPPGCGKSMLAERFNSLLPPLSESEMLEVARIHSIAGLVKSRALDGVRPFRAPHHTVSDAGLIGGGSNPRPGEISLAHRGVLFLDEFPEFRRSAIEALRAPLETSVVNISRARGNLQFPARFQLIAAMNPCPCGRIGVPGTSCLCSRSTVQNYLKKLSQPILDRIDLHVDLDAVPVSNIVNAIREDPGEEDFSEQVAMARQFQLEQYSCLNAELSTARLKDAAQLTDGSLRLIEKVSSKTGLSARGYLRVLRVALTISNLDGCAKIEEEHLAEAIGYRSLDTLQKYVT